MSPQRTRNNGGKGSDDALLGLLVIAGVVGGTVVGIPGIGLYVGLVFGSIAAQAVATPGVQVNPAAAPHEKMLASIRANITHPFSPENGTGSMSRWWPPNRLSAWWCVLLAGLFAAIPVMVAATGVHHTILLRLERVPMLAASAVGYFIAFQAVASSRRTGEPVLIQKAAVRGHSEHLAPAPIFGLGVAILTFLALRNADSLAAFLNGGRAKGTGPSAYAGLHFRGALGAAVGAGFIVAFIIASKAYAKWWREPSEAQNALRDKWAARWMQVLPPRTPPPVFIGETTTPEDAPLLNTATFMVAPGRTIREYAAVTTQFAGMLGTTIVDIVPLPAADEERKAISGVQSTTHFKVEWAVSALGPRSHLGEGFEEKSPLFDFAISSRFGKIFEDLGFGRPTLWGTGILTTPESAGRMVETMWMLDEGVTFDKVANAAESVREKAGARWLRVGRRSTIYGAGEYVPISYVSLVFGDPPSIATFADTGRIPAAANSHFVDVIDWEERFRQVGLTPQMLLGRRERPGDVTEWKFSYTGGASAGDVRSRLSKLRASGFGYLDFRPALDPATFNLLTAETDPLQQDYLFKEWAKEILRNPDPGYPSLRLVIGVSAERDLVEFELGDEFPHMLVAGDTGSGKSQCLESLLLQLAVANTPDDLNFRLVDPKTSLTKFASLAHTTHFVEIPSHGDIYAEFSYLLAETYTEMNWRNQRIKRAGFEDLRSARAAGKLLDMPVVVMVLEETAMLLSPGDSKTQKTMEDYLRKLVNLGRSSGIHILVVTQYPTNETVPNSIRQQLNRVAFKMKDEQGSRQAIGSGGLENMPKPGMGVAVLPGRTVPFRGFFFRPETAERQSDVDWVISHLPRHERPLTSTYSRIDDAIAAGVHGEVQVPVAATEVAEADEEKESAPLLTFVPRPIPPGIFSEE